MAAGGSRRGFGAAVAAFAVILAAAGTSRASESVQRPGPVTSGSASFCAPGKLVRDFGLSHLPKVREVPARGDIPFGPKTVSLISLSAGRIIPIDSDFGYELSSENQSGRTPLHWTVRARMVRVDRRGRRGRVVDRKRATVKTINSRRNVDLYLHQLRRPGFYLYEIEFLDRKGKLLGRYGKHLKVFAHAYWKARLGLSRHVAPPGQQVLSWVENLGTETVMFGAEFYIHRLEGEQWVPVPDATQRFWPLWLGGAGPGVSGRCSTWRIPIDFPLGQYRIVKEVGARPWPNGSRSRYLTAPINVAIN